ncbi:MAG: FMN-binding protein [Proteobacteria bacterium]|nr:FMN-binding protein [Pseudomonadota bacterium]
MSSQSRDNGALAGPVVTAASPWLMYRALVGIGLLCGLLIATVYRVTLPVIEANKAEALERAVFRVLPAARSSVSFAMDADGRFAQLDRGSRRNSGHKADGAASGNRLVYAGYDEQGQLVGLAIEAEGMGYQDLIRILYGYSFDDRAIIGMRVLESRETPGLGDKIEKDATFLANFERLDVSLDNDGAIAHPIEAVKRGEKVSPWQVDAITGATISSHAIADILRRSSIFWIPRVVGRRADFRLPRASHNDAAQ